MVHKLDPRYPVVWRRPTSLQVGVDPARVRLDDVTHAQERMLAALATGVSGPGLTMIANGAAGERDALLAALSPVLLREAPALAASVTVSGSGSLVDSVARALAGSGIAVTVGADATPGTGAAPDLAILASQHVTPPWLHSAWLRRDVPHLPVVITDGGVHVGPVVEPGVGPCLLCLELHRRDADPAWPAIATQLLGRRPIAPPPLLVLESAAVVVRMALARLSAGAGPAIAVRLDAHTGQREQAVCEPHPECGCRGIDGLAGLGPDMPSAGLRGTGSPGAAHGPAPRWRTSSARAAAARA